MEDLVIKNAILDYFSGRATPLQKQAIESWLSDTANHEQYYQWLHDWELMHLQASTKWQNDFANTKYRVIKSHNEEVLQPALTKPIHITYTYLRSFVAAVFLFLLLGLYAYTTRENIFFKTSKAAYGETKRIKLPDGSLVTLNANSSIRYPRFGFGDGSRQIELAGEADFEIKSTPNRQKFIVSTMTGLKITVLGTEFTVLARPRGSQVILRNGKVALQTPQLVNDLPIEMNPGDVIAISIDGKLSCSHTSHPEQYASWKESKINLDRTSLREIATVLEDLYGLSIELHDPHLGDKTATGLLPTQNADSTIKLIGYMFDIEITRQGDKVIFAK